MANTPWYATIELLRQLRSLLSGSPNLGYFIAQRGPRPMSLSPVRLGAADVLRQCGEEALHRRSTSVSPRGPAVPRRSPSSAEPRTSREGRLAAELAVARPVALRPKRWVVVTLRSRRRGSRAAPSPAAARRRRRPRRRGALGLAAVRGDLARAHMPPAGGGERGRKWTTPSMI
jgi:hypothetical protein